MKEKHYFLSVIGIFVYPLDGQGAVQSADFPCRDVAVKRENTEKGVF